MIQSRKLVAELTAKVAEEQAKLSAIEARGYSVTRLLQSVILAEGALKRIAPRSRREGDPKAGKRAIGWELPVHKVRSETLKGLALDISVQSLRQFAIQQQRGTTNDVTLLRQRLDVVGGQLVALREHIEKD